MMTVLPLRAVVKFADFFRRFDRSIPAADLTILDEAEMPEWQRRDLGFQDGRPNFRDDILRR